MWWLFEKKDESDLHVLYAYSRGNRALDGLVRMNKHTSSVEVVKACKADGSKENAEDALEFLYGLQEEGFPQHRQIACG